MLALSVGVQIWLSSRQINHVKSHRNAVPDAFKDQIPLDAHQKAADYTLARTRFGFLDLFIGTLVLLGWTFAGGFEALDQSIREFGWNPVWTGVAVLMAASLISSLMDMPTDLWRTFRIEQKFGFNRNTPGLYLRDQLMQTALLFALGVPLMWVALTLMSAAGEYWWVWLWLFWSGFMLLMMWAFPTFIAPLFNTFTPLADEDLKQRIEALMDRCGFISKGIFVMDGSRRSAHGNAYFTGIGNNKRIVFYDTLLEGLNSDEIEAVLAHELGHFRRNHVRKRLITSLVLSLIGLGVLGLLVESPWFYSGLGVDTPSNYAALFLFMLAMPVFTLVLQPISSRLSRKHEFEADDYAAEQSDAGKLIQALVKMYKENASTLTPDPLYSAFHDSHPPAPVRVARLSGKLAPTD